VTAGGGYVARVGIMQAAGVRFGDGLTVEALAERWDEVLDLADGREFQAGASEQGDWVLSQL
jgi:hypothetical protein